MPLDVAVSGLWALLLGLSSLYGLHRLFVLALYGRHRGPDAPAPPLAALPAVTVQLPVYNERAVVEGLIDAVAALDWPRHLLTVQVLDDSTDDSAAIAKAAVARHAAAGLSITWIGRPQRTGFKAGALDHGLKQGAADIIAIFDADFRPPANFLRATVPHLLADPQVGMVQARWGHENLGANLLTRLSGLLLDGHFLLEHTARHRSGRFFNFNGTAGLWRRAAIEGGGGWQHDTLTEDLDLSYRAQLAGWRFVYLRDHVVPAELPDGMRAFKSQQRRWAQGTMQTARKLGARLLFAPLPWKTRAEALAHLGCNLTYPLLLAMALLLPLLAGHPAEDHAAAAIPGALSVVGLVFYAVAAREAEGSWLRAPWRLPLVIALGVGLSVSQTRAVFAGLFGQDTTFVRTPKRGGLAALAYPLRLDWTPWVELAIAAFYLAALPGLIAAGRWGVLPFLLLFGLGFAGVGLGSLRRG